LEVIKRGNTHWLLTFPQRKCLRYDVKIKNRVESLDCFENLVSVAGNEFLRESRDIVFGGGGRSLREIFVGADLCSPDSWKTKTRQSAPSATVNMF
jgi:hypothetical protein